jgi:hypothetical protein
MTSFGRKVAILLANTVGPLSLVLDLHIGTKDSGVVLILVLMDTYITLMKRSKNNETDYRLLNTHNTDTHLYVFSLDLTLPLIINSIP